MPDGIVITGAHCLIDGGFEEATVVVSGGRIAEIRADAGRPDRGALWLDGRGLILAPAIVDVHGDAFERQVMPRPGVFVPLDAALIETDRQLAANGIATAYHAVTLSWEPGLRGLDRAREILRALRRLAPDLCVENRVQLRWETFAFEALDLIAEALAGPLLPSIAFNDHVSMMMLDPSVPVQRRPFEQAPDYPVMDLADPKAAPGFAAQAKRSGLSTAEYVAMLGGVWTRRAEVPDMIGRVAAMGRAAGAPMLSHDDAQAETRRFYRALGVGVSEFPMSPEAARAARLGGDTIIFGAPNAMRGGSHLGSPGAGDMIAEGLCDALASDYYYPALPAALAKLEAERRAPRAALWALVSEAPARAMGLGDRGRLAAGLRADLVLMDWPPDRQPVMRATIAGGRLAWLAHPADGRMLIRDAGACA